MQPSTDDRQRLEAMLRNPQVFAGTPQAIVDETLKRATKVLEQSKANEQALKTAAEQREAALRRRSPGPGRSTQGGAGTDPRVDRAD